MKIVHNFRFMTFFRSKEDTYFIIAGLADGRLMFYHEPLLMVCA